MKKLFIKYLLLFQFGLILNVFANFPEKPITIIVHSKPGSGIDITARQFANIAHKYTNTTFLVENKTGGSGMIAMRNILSKRADGYSILAVTKSFISTMQLTNAGITVDDFDWFAGMVVDPEVLITNKNSEIKTLKDIIEDAKKKNGKQRWLGPLVGGLDHLVAIKIWQKLGIKAEWIPYEGGSDAVAALMGKHGAVYVGNPVDAKGRPSLMIAAIATEKRLQTEQLKDVPTFLELGYDIKNEVLWRGFALKKGTNPEAKNFLTDIFKKVSNDKDWQKFIKSSSAQPVFWNEEEFTKNVIRDKNDALKYLKIAGVLGKENKKVKNHLMVFSVMFFLYLLIITIIYKTQKNWFKGDVIISLGLLFLSVYTYYLTLEFPIGKLGGKVGPASIPRLWSVLLAFFSIWLFYQSIRNTKKQITEKRETIRTLGLIILMSLYLIIISYIGYYLSTGIFLVTGMLWMKYKRFVPILLTTGGFLLMSYYVIEILLKVPLPKGVFFY